MSSTPMTGLALVVFWCVMGPVEVSVGIAEGWESMRNAYFGNFIVSSISMSLHFDYYIYLS